MLLPHNKVSGGVQGSQIMIPSFFDRFYVMPPLTNGVHYTVNSKPRTIEPNRYWGIDMTKVMIPAYGWIYLHVVIDWGTKKLLSVHMSLTSKSSDWITALNEAVNLQFPDGIKDAHVFRH